MPLSKIQLSSSTGRRNLIINGALNIDQRLSYGTTTTADGSGYLGDRLNIEGLVGGGGATMQVVSDAPDAFPNGRSAKVTVTGTDTSLADADRYTLRHIIEGRNSARLGFGTSNAKTCTLSFYVKSSQLALSVLQLVMVQIIEVDHLNIQSTALIHGKEKSLKLLEIHLVHI